MELGIEIARLRAKLNLTQRQFANKSHTSVVNVSSWEKGITYPDIQMTKRIADVLNISACDLLKSVDIDDEVVGAEVDDKQYIKFVHANLISLLFISIALIFVILLSELQPNSADNLTPFFIIHTLIIIVCSLLVVASIGLFIYNICHFHNYLKDGFHTKTYNANYMAWLGVYLLTFTVDIVCASLVINLL